MQVVIQVMQVISHEIMHTYLLVIPAVWKHPQDEKVPDWARFPRPICPMKEEGNLVQSGNLAWRLYISREMTAAKVITID